MTFIFLNTHEEYSTQVYHFNYENYVSIGSMEAILFLTKGQRSRSQVETFEWLESLLIQGRCM